MEFAVFSGCLFLRYLLVLSALLVQAANTDEVVIEVPLELSHALPSLNCKINDVPTSLVLDTGCSMSAIDRGDTLLRGKGIRSTVIVANELHEARIVEFAHIQLGAETFTGGVAVLQQPNRISDVVPGAVGFLGMDLFKHHVIEVNVDQKIMRVYRAVPASVDGHFDRIPFKLQRGRPIITMPVPGLGDRPFLLDTGSAFGLTLSHDDFQSLLISRQIRKTAQYDGRSLSSTQSYCVGIVEEIDLQPFHPVKNVCCKMGTGKTTDQIGTIGWGLLRDLNVVVDFANECIYVQRSKNGFTAGKMDMSGIQAVRDAHEVRIADCVRGSPASNCGIRVGDRLLSVNGQDARELGYYELSTILASEGKTVSLNWQRDGVTYSSEIELRDFRTYANPNGSYFVPPLWEGPLIQGCPVPAVQLTIGGHEVVALFDTCCAVTAIDRTLAKHLVSTAALLEHKDGTRHELISATIGSFRLGHVDVEIADLADHSRLLETKVGMVIGLDLMSRFVTRLDLARQRVCFFPDVPWQELPTYQRIALNVSEDGISVDAKFAKGRTEALLLASCVQPSVVLRHSVFQDLKKSGELTEIEQRKRGSSVSRQSTADFGTVSSISIGTVPENDIRVMSDARSAVGLNWLSKFIVIVDIQGEQLYLKPDSQKLK